MNRLKTARFWEWLNDGWVKLSIPPGKRWEWGFSASTDEGWASETRTWTNDGEAVTCETVDDGRDCDGRLTQNYVHHCPIENLRYHQFFDDKEDRDENGRPVFTPLWEKDNASVYDENAVAANY